MFKANFWGGVNCQFGYHAHFISCNAFMMNRKLSLEQRFNRKPFEFGICHRDFMICFARAQSIHSDNINCEFSTGAWAQGLFLLELVQFWTSWLNALWKPDDQLQLFTYGVWCEVGLPSFRGHWTIWTGIVRAMNPKIPSNSNTVPNWRFIIKKKYTLLLLKNHHTLFISFFWGNGL